MDGGPKSLKAGLKFDDEGRDGDGTDEPECGEKCGYSLVITLMHCCSF